jgi:exonuclease III
MKIASFNVNGVNGRLSVLLRWLESARPDIVCLQELKSPDERFPFGNREGRLRRDLAQPEKLERRGRLPLPAQRQSRAGTQV